MRDLPSRNTNSSKRQRETKVEQRYERGQGFGQVQAQRKGQSGQPRPPLPPPKSNFRGLSQELGVGSPEGLVIQPKLTIGAPNDKYEQEADRIAAQVVQQLNAPKLAPSAPTQSIQRETLPDEDEKLQMKPDTLQYAELSSEEGEIQAKSNLSARTLTDRPRVSDLRMKSLPTTLQREAIDSEELQLKQIGSDVSVNDEASTDLEFAINSARGSGQPLEKNLQQQMGQLLGVDLRSVKIHTNAQADALNQSLHSLAFTTGQDLFFKQGKYDPGSRSGQELIAHELTHVIQQQRQPRMLNQVRGKFEEIKLDANVGQLAQLTQNARNLEYKDIVDLYNSYKKAEPHKETNLVVDIFDKSKAWLEKHGKKASHSKKYWDITRLKEACKKECENLYGNNLERSREKIVAAKASPGNFLRANGENNVERGSIFKIILGDKYLTEVTQPMTSMVEEIKMLPTEGLELKEHKNYSGNEEKVPTDSPSLNKLTQIYLKMLEGALKPIPEEAKQALTLLHNLVRDSSWPEGAEQTSGLPERAIRDALLLRTIAPMLADATKKNLSIKIKSVYTAVNKAFILQANQTTISNFASEGSHIAAYIIQSDGKRGEEMMTKFIKDSILAPSDSNFDRKGS